MTLAEQIALDCANVFANTSEFGESVVYHREVDGADASGFPLTIDAVCEDAEVRRESYDDHLVSDVQQLIVHVQLADVTPEVDTDYIVRGGIDWTVMEILEQSHGMSRLRCEALDMVRRGGREVRR